MTTHLTHYDPLCRCSHCTRTAQGAHEHYQKQFVDMQEQVRRLAEQVPPPPPPPSPLPYFPSPNPKLRP